MVAKDVGIMQRAEVFGVGMGIGRIDDTLDDDRDVDDEVQTEEVLGRQGGWYASAATLEGDVDDFFCS